MPSNWIVATPEPIALELLSVLPEKVEQILDDLIHGKECRTKPHIWDRFISLLGKIEVPLARKLGKTMRVSGACNGCEWCSKNCTSINIVMGNNRPQFCEKCHLCLKCIYGCPKKALGLGFAQFVVIPNGFSMKTYMQKKSDFKRLDRDIINTLCKGYTWLGIKKYLLDSSKESSIKR